METCKVESSSSGAHAAQFPSDLYGHSSTRQKGRISTYRLRLLAKYTRLTLEQVDELYGLVDKAWQSKAFRPAVSYHEAQTEGDANMDMRQMSIAQETRRASSARHGTGKELS